MAQIVLTCIPFSDRCSMLPYMDRCSIYKSVLCIYRSVLYSASIAAAYMVLAYIVRAEIVMVCNIAANVAMAYIVMAQTPCECHHSFDFVACPCRAVLCRDVPCFACATLINTA